MKVLDREFTVSQPAQADLSMPELKQIFEDIARANGSRMVKPFIKVPYAVGISLRVGALREIVRMFTEKKRAQHSGMGGTVWVPVSYCIAHSLPYRLTHDPNLGGFSVELLDLDWYTK